MYFPDKRPTSGTMANNESNPRDVKGVRNFGQAFHLRPKDIGALIWEAANSWSDDNAPRLSASLAFYTLLSLTPLVVVVVAVAAMAFGREAAEGQLAREISGVVGFDGAKAIQDLIQAATKTPGGAIAPVLSLLTAAIGGSAVVMELRDALNTIWHVPADPSKTGFASIRIMLQQRFYSFVMVLGIGILLMVSLLWSAWISGMGKFFGSSLAINESILHIIAFLISFVVITFLFAAIYKIVPDVELQWSDVLVGASVTSLTFTVGKQLIGLYLGKAGVGSAYGAAGSLVLVLVWVYYSAQLFFFGAEFTKVYARKHGSHFDAKAEPDTAAQSLK
jgi:membrane protein